MFKAILWPLSGDKSQASVSSDPIKKGGKPKLIGTRACDLSPCRKTQAKFWPTRVRDLSLRTPARAGGKPRQDEGDTLDTRKDMRDTRCDLRFSREIIGRKDQGMREALLAIQSLRLKVF